MSRPRPEPRDLLALTKPGILRMCLITTAGGMLMAPGTVTVRLVLATFVGTGLAVAGANAFNMWLERDTDRHMRRTCRRPLPTGRLDPNTAVRFAALLSLLSFPVLAIGANLLTAVLALLAIVGYVCVYTPLKYRSPLALVIGAVPGAAPPLLGWTAVSGSLDPGGLVLFGILLVWQMPHFIAIALMRKAEYARAGIKTVPNVRGDAIAKIQAVAWALALVPLSLMLTPLGVAGFTYFCCAFVLGMVYASWGFTGLDSKAGPTWARRYFFASLVYLPALMGSLALDAFL